VLNRIGMGTTLTAFLSYRPVRPPLWAALALSALACGASATAEQSDQPSKRDAQKLEEMIVSAEKLDRRTLENDIIPRFVTSHSAQTRAIDQVTRWRTEVCPKVTGLSPLYGEFVTRRILEQAQSIGAPTRGAGQPCRVNIEVVFTSVPQELLNHIAKAYPQLLGSARVPHDTTMSHAIQGWYLTGTHAVNSSQLPVIWPPPFRDPSNIASIGPDTGPVVQADPPYGGGTAPYGLGGSHLSVGLESQLLHVLVIVDEGRMPKIPLGAVASYVAMIALTRMASLDTCSELPSIIDLFASGCDDRAKPDSITAADTAFLKSLYAADLEQNGNVEQGEIGHRMLTELLAR
jgi:hypothetical protein